MNRMKFFGQMWTLCCVALVMTLFSSCGKTVKCESVDIVPRPISVEMKDGTYKFKLSAINDIVTYKQDKTLGEEAYILDVDKKEGITIYSSSAAGTFYAIETFKQMVPAGAVSVQKAKYGVIPCCTIKDAPSFGYRGTHLDCSRHFFTIDEVKKFIDILAMHKINRFHWHLTDDQGWRIEIRKYPQLTEVGAFRDKTVVKKNWGEYDGVRYGGFYTQEEIKDVVAYAAAHFITVIPEIEIPGHALAALASYPELGCRGDHYEVSPTWGVFPEVFCPGKESTFQFWEDVLTEVMELFPSKYIHIGGDECPKDEWEKCPLCQQRIKEEGLKNEFELQSYVTRRVEAFLNAHGRQVIGWDEILEGGVTPTATIMSWRGTDGGIAAAQAGNKVIMTPNTYCYLDYYQSKNVDNEPFGIGGYLPVEQCYSFDPYNGLTKDQQQYILGVQGNLWTEYVSTFDHLTYMLLPRMSALAEVAWSYGNTDYEDFVRRMANTTKYYDVFGWNWCHHIFGEATAE